jgi:hypothetical protein
LITYHLLCVGRCAPMKNQVEGHGRNQAHAQSADEGNEPPPSDHFCFELGQLGDFASLVPLLLLGLDRGSLDGRVLVGLMWIPRGGHHQLLTCVARRIEGLVVAEPIILVLMLIRRIVNVNLNITHGRKEGLLPTAVAVGTGAASAAARGMRMAVPHGEG